MVKKIVTEERCITISELSQCLSIKERATHAFLKEVCIRKLLSRFVPQFLTSEMQECGLECSLANLKILEE